MTLISQVGAPSWLRLCRFLVWIIFNFARNDSEQMNTWKHNFRVIWRTPIFFFFFFEKSSDAKLTLVEYPDGWINLSKNHFSPIFPLKLTWTTLNPFSTPTSFSSTHRSGFYLDWIPGWSSTDSPAQAQCVLSSCISKIPINRTKSESTAVVAEAVRLEMCRSGRLIWTSAQ